MKNKKLIKIAALTLLSASLVTAATTVSTVGDKMDNAGQYVSNKASSAAEALDPRSPTQKAGDKIDGAVSDTADALDPRSPAQKAGDKIDNATK